MDLDRPQLSALSSSLGDLLDRLTRIAEGYADSPREGVAADLFEVERHLQAAVNRLQALLDRVG